MKLETALVNIIQAAGHGQIGRTLFHTHMPAQVTEGTLVLTRVAIFKDPFTGLRKGPFQVVCRAATPEAAHGKAVAIIDALRTEGAVLNEVDFKFIFPINEPLVYPRTDGGQFEASVNYQFAAYWEN